MFIRISVHELYRLNLQEAIYLYRPSPYVEVRAECAFRLGTILSSCVVCSSVTIQERLHVFQLPFEVPI